MADPLDPYRRQLELYQFQMGPECGRLATALDVLTDAMALIGQHGVYCRRERRPDQESLDIRTVVGQLESSKVLISKTMQEIRENSGGG